MNGQECPRERGRMKHPNIYLHIRTETHRIRHGGNGQTKRLRSQHSDGPSVQSSETFPLLKTKNPQPEEAATLVFRLRTDKGTRHASVLACWQHVWTPRSQEEPGRDSEGKKEISKGKKFINVANQTPFPTEVCLEERWKIKATAFHFKEN